MGADLLAGTDDGLLLLRAGEPRRLLEGPVAALASVDGVLWTIAGGSRILRSEDGGDWEPAAELPDQRVTCLLPTEDGVFAGSTEAHLFHLRDGSLEPVDSFERVEGREGWYTPWGGPPATRSLSRDDSGAIYANVHVGGIPKSVDGGASWHPTLEVDADAHEVRAVPGQPGLVLAATAIGLGESRDGGGSWHFHDDGLEGRYSRAVAVHGETLFLSASDGPRGGRAALYRRALESEAPFERCREGLPEWFDTNIDTACLDAGPGTIAFGTAAGGIYASGDGGASWAAVAGKLPPVRCLLAR
jgi:hypothetical protein